MLGLDLFDRGSIAASIMVGSMVIACGDDGAASDGDGGSDGGATSTDDDGTPTSGPNDDTAGSGDGSDDGDTGPAGQGSGELALVRFMSGGDSELLVVDFATGDVTSVATNFVVSGPVWSPDGAWLAYATAGGEFVSDVFVADVAAGTSTQVSAEPLSFVGGWSPDGTTLAYTGDNQVRIVGADGTGAAAVSQLPSEAYSPQFSPDGAKILYVGRLDGDEVYVANADGTGETALTADSGASSPVWSPDSTTIAYTHGQRLASVGADGTGATDLTPDTDNYRSPQWSPDGTQLAACATVGGQPVAAIMNADGTGATNPAVACTQIRWSPDGTRVAICGGDGVTTVDASGGADTLVTADPCQHVAWSPDGTMLAYDTNAPGMNTVLVVDTVGGTPFAAVAGDLPTVDFTWRPGR
jgi:Tol biopolymer transport system component